MNPAIAARRRQKAAEARANQTCDTCDSEVNVSQNERWLSLIGGGALLAGGLIRGSMSGVVLASLGAALAYRGFTGHCHLYDALRYSTAEGAEH
jgi:uncharacterized membrane protein